MLTPVAVCKFPLVLNEKRVRPKSDLLLVSKSLNGGRQRGNISVQRELRVSSPYFWTVHVVGQVVAAAGGVCWSDCWPGLLVRK